MNLTSILQPSKWFLYIGLGLSLIGLSGCATAPKDQDLAVDNGPSFLIEGRLSVRRPGQQTLIATYSWARGYLENGWVERINLYNDSNIRILRLVGNENFVTIQTTKKNYSHTSLADMFEREIGFDIDPVELAYLVINQHRGDPLPDKLKVGNIHVEVLDRKSNGYPQRMRLIGNDSILLIAITNFA